MREFEIWYLITMFAAMVIGVGIIIIINHLKTKKEERRVKMLDIKKIGEGFYLINGEYIASTYSQAVIIANQDTKIKGFTVDFMEASFWKNLKNKLNYPFKKLESWM